MNRLEIGWGKTKTIIGSWPLSEFLSSIEFINAYGLHGVLMKGAPFYPLHRKSYRPIKNQLHSLDRIWDVFLGVTRTCGGDSSHHDCRWGRPWNGRVQSARYLGEERKSMILADEKRKGYWLAMFFCLDGAYSIKTELMPKRVLRLKRKCQSIYSAPSKQA